MHEIPTLLTPVAGLAVVALLVTPVEYRRSRRRLQRWARDRAWSCAADGRPWRDLVRQIEQIGQVGLGQVEQIGQVEPVEQVGQPGLGQVEPVGQIGQVERVGSAEQVGPVVCGPFEGWQVTAFEVALRPAGERAGRGRRVRYTAVAVRLPRSRADRSRTTPARGGRSAIIAVRDGWVIALAPTTSPERTVTELLPVAARAARAATREAARPVVAVA